MFLEPLILKHSASLTRTITLISEVRGREARPHMVPEKEAATLRFRSWDSGWHPRMVR